MNLLFVSQCNKNALKETRRILDQFAERKGMRTWQSSMTDEGQRTLRKALQRTARKNTAVSCHWIRGGQRSELLWIVGNRAQFDEEGTVPTNRTRRDVLRTQDENDWHAGELIYLLSGTAALFHDLGKACDAFQKMLRGKGHAGRNFFRHEWLSLRLLENFVRRAGGEGDEPWIRRLLESDGYTQHDWLDGLIRDDLAEGAPSPFVDMPPIAQSIGWLLLSHHRMPKKPRSEHKTFVTADAMRLFDHIDAGWNDGGVPTSWLEEDTPPPQQIADGYWTFSRGLSVDNPEWKKKARRFARRWIAWMDKEPVRGWLDDPFVMHLSRLTLMLADHNGSAKTSMLKHDPASNFANTSRDGDERQLNQGLDEHLLLITREAGAIAHGLPRMRPSLSALARHKRLKARTSMARFRWQNKAADLAQSIRHRSAEHGAFLVNMASTGAGKTFANARIMYALANPQKGARFCIALGLRTLTRQTGRAYRDRLALTDRELAIRVGGAPGKELFEHYQNIAEQSGSSSSVRMTWDNEYVVYEGDYSQNQLLQRLIRDRKVRSVLDAPVLVCTVDHLMPATESGRGGHQIPGMLRLMGSDLVLDEVDDFGLDDLPAISRLVNWAGMLGCRVMLSSATLPPSIVEALFDAYQHGRLAYEKHVGDPGLRHQIVCGWFDERRAVVSDCAERPVFARAHQEFVDKRAQFLGTQEPRRIARILDVREVALTRGESMGPLAQPILESANALHWEQCTTDLDTGKRVSFGLVRMANIQPLVQLARALYQVAPVDDTRVHLCVYHSQFPLIARSHIEHVLDTTLSYSGDRSPLQSRFVRERVRQGDVANHIFIVLASPVAEVGRDHDYDWAIVEPSSVRSLIQLAGRVRRHREGGIAQPNVVLLSHNVRTLYGGNGPFFTRPGFEGKKNWRLRSHDLHDLLSEELLNGLDARARIQECGTLSPRTSLADLEHARLRGLLLPKDVQDAANAQRRKRFIAADWWREPRVTLSGLMQQWRPFRKRTGEEVTLLFMPDEDTGELTLYKEHEQRGRESLYIPIEHSMLERLDERELTSSWVTQWPRISIPSLLQDKSDDETGWSAHDARRYTRVQMRNSTRGWLYHPAFGFFNRQ